MGLDALDGHLEGVGEAVYLFRRFIGDLFMQLVPGEFIDSRSQLLRIGDDGTDRPRQDEGKVDFGRGFHLPARFLARDDPGHEILCRAGWFELLFFQG